MARLIPARLEPGLPDGERAVLAAFAEQFPAAWTLFHHLAYSKPRGDGSPARPPREAELDLLLLAPQRGCLAIEIKSGGVSRTADGWASVDRHGVAHPIKDPARQAADAARFVRRLGRQPGGAWKTDADAPPIEWAVAFPDLDVHALLDPALPRERTLDRDDLRALAPKLDRLLPANGAPDFGARQQLALERALAPVFELMVPMATWIARDEAALIRLTDEQRHVLACVATNRRLSIRGGAGTGKTLLARETARRLSESGERVLLLCFNKLLAELLERGSASYEVSTFHGLAEQLAKEAGLAWAPPPKDDPDPAFWRDTANDLLFTALERLPERRWDAVLVDEAQDFAEPWWITVESLLADAKRSRLWLFHDPEQAIFAGPEAPTVPEEDLGLTRFDLPWNCRNTRRIAEHAWSYLHAAPPLHENAPEGEPPREVTCKDEAAMLAELRKALDSLRKDAKLPASSILVLTPFNLDKSAVWKQRNRLLPHELVRLEPGGPALDLAQHPNAIPMASLARFKGLESDAVVLVEVRAGSKACTERHLYVGASRARHVLIQLRYPEEPRNS